MTPAVYLLHFEWPLHHAGHYMGSARDVEARLRQHASGNGARLVEVMRGLGIGFTLARLWPCDTEKEARQLERRLKRHNNGRRNCPVCNPKKKFQNSPKTP